LFLVYFLHFFVFVFCTGSKRKGKEQGKTRKVEEKV